MGRARAADLRRVVEEIRGRQARLGPDAVRFAWHKVHVSTRGNESVDHLAKEWADLPEESEWEGVGGWRTVTVVEGEERGKAQGEGDTDEEGREVE